MELWAEALESMSGLVLKESSVALVGAVGGDSDDTSFFVRGISATRVECFDVLGHRIS